MCTFSGTEVWKRPYCFLSQIFSDRIIFFASFNGFPGIISYVGEVLNSREEGLNKIWQRGQKIGPYSEP